MLLEEYLNLKGYQVDKFNNGQLALEAFKKNKDDYDIGIFDVMMPLMDGFTLAKNVKQDKSNFPIIFLTAKSLQEDIIKGFRIGADDYLTKPFSMEELQLRINAVLRRVQSSPLRTGQNVFEIGSFTFDSKLQQLKHEKGSQQLTTKESELLKMLCERMNDVLERSEALNTIWEEDNYFTARSMDVYITKLRKYLKADESIQIKNIHGKGYRLLTAVEEM
ncbi:UNVERIFIED_CONTAM: hypothetical protein GTU68_049498 [Idotea baltica]|nr:hypothetical protein [Idotea baltica]